MNTIIEHYGIVDTILLFYAILVGSLWVAVGVDRFMGWLRRKAIESVMKCEHRRETG